MQMSSPSSFRQFQDLIYQHKLYNFNCNKFVPDIFCLWTRPEKLLTSKVFIWYLQNVLGGWWCLGMDLGVHGCCWWVRVGLYRVICVYGGSGGGNCFFWWIKGVLKTQIEHNESIFLKYSKVLTKLCLYIMNIVGWLIWQDLSGEMSSRIKML